MPSPPPATGPPPERPLLVTGSRLPDGTQVLVLAGELDLAGTAELERRVRSALPGAARLALDLRELEFMDSSGLAAIVRLDEEVRGRGTTMWCVIAAEGPVRKLIELTRVSEILDLREEPPG